MSIYDSIPSEEVAEGPPYFKGPIYKQAQYTLLNTKIPNNSIINIYIPQKN